MSNFVVTVPSSILGYNLKIWKTTGMSDYFPHLKYVCIFVELQNSCNSRVAELSHIVVCPIFIKSRWKNKVRHRLNKMIKKLNKEASDLDSMQKYLRKDDNNNENI